MKNDSPCKGCTTETGRGSDFCRSIDCPRGWYDWSIRHAEEREERARRYRLEAQADLVLIDGNRKRRKRR